MEFYHHDFLQNIDNLDEIISSIAQNSPKIKDLVVDPLVGTELTTEDCKKLSKALLKNTNLVNFDCAGQALGDLNAQLLLTSLRNCKNLTAIDLSDNTLEHQFVGELEKLLKRIHANKAQRYRQRNGVSIFNVANQSASSFPKTHKSNNNSNRNNKSHNNNNNNVNMTIILDNNEIGDEGAKRLGKAISTGGISDLRIRSNHISSEGAATIFDAIAKNTSNLNTLHLNGNNIGSLFEHRRCNSNNNNNCNKNHCEGNEDIKKHRMKNGERGGGGEEEEDEGEDENVKLNLKVIAKHLSSEFCKLKYLDLGSSGLSDDDLFVILNSRNRSLKLTFIQSTITLYPFILLSPSSS